jgi:hypothetical protein
LPDLPERSYAAIMAKDSQSGDSVGNSTTKFTKSLPSLDINTERQATGPEYNANPFDPANDMWGTGTHRGLTIGSLNPSLSNTSLGSTKLPADAEYVGTGRSKTGDTNVGFKYQGDNYVLINTPRGTEVCSGGVCGITLYSKPSDAIDAIRSGSLKPEVGSNPTYFREYGISDKASDVPVAKHVMKRRYSASTSQISKIRSQVSKNQNMRTNKRISF